MIEKELVQKKRGRYLISEVMLYPENRYTTYLGRLC
jgi:hypothetical protein